MTDKLYLQDAYIQDFQAKVLESRQTADGWEVILDQTAFYPEGGGQPCDTGTIAGFPVLAVRSEGERVVHVIQGMPTTDTVIGRINWSRRFYHMQQHSGQHILSAVFDDKWQAETVGFHLGMDSTQIDLSIADLKPEQVAEAETAANSAIYANLQVTAEWVSQEDLERFPLRKRPAKEFSKLRLISAGNIDCCPCGGTHVKSTGEIGMIKILGWERKNNAVRVDFICGMRALTDYQFKHRLIQEMATRLSAPVKDLSEVFAQRLAKTDTLTKELAATRLELSQFQAASLLQTAPLYKDVRLIVHCLQDAQPNDAAQLARNLTTTIPAIALVAAIVPGGAKSHLVFATNTDELDMGKLLKAALAKLNGKGGGNSRLAQGGANNSAKLQEVMNEALADVEGLLHR